MRWAWLWRPASLKQPRNNPLGGARLSMNYLIVHTFFLGDSTGAWERTNPAFGYLMRFYLVVILSSAECERIFSRLKLVKTRLRNLLTKVTLEQILQVALNGPSLEEFIKSGLMEQVLTYYFSKCNRNARSPLRYTDHFLKLRLEKLVWGTHCKFKTPLPITLEAARQEQIDLGWVSEEDVDEGEAAQAIDDALAVLEAERGKRAGTHKPGHTLFLSLAFWPFFFSISGADVRRQPPFYHC